MTPKERAAIQQALEALVELVEKFDYEQYTSICELDHAKDTILILQEALAEQAEQEPVAWLCDGEAYEVQQYDWQTDLPFPNQIPLYAAPVRTKDLTDEEIRKLWSDAELDITWFARAVITADREKNK